MAKGNADLEFKLKKVDETINYISEKIKNDLMKKNTKRSV